MMDFYDLCQQFHVTPEEREKLAWFLGQMRAKATYQALAKDNAERKQP